MRRIGVLMGLAADDPEARPALRRSNRRWSMGWNNGRNVRSRSVGPEEGAAAQHSGGTGRPRAGRDPGRRQPAVGPCCRDPDRANRVHADARSGRSGLRASLAQPGGNATGFTQFEYGIGAKWLELLKQIAPSVTRAAVLRDPAIPPGVGQFAAIQSVAPSLGVEVTPIECRDADEIERDITGFARVPNGGLIVTAERWRQLLIAI